MALIVQPGRSGRPEVEQADLTVEEWWTYLYLARLAKEIAFADDASLREWIRTEGARADAKLRLGLEGLKARGLLVTEKDERGEDCHRFIGKVIRRLRAVDPRTFGAA